jgi:septation ring formation regulator EzrA
MELTWILQTITTLVIAVVGYFFKGTLTELKEGIKQNAGDIKEVKAELNDLKSDLPFIYVLREDFIRTLNNVDSKMNNIDGKIDKLLEIKSKGE